VRGKSSKKRVKGEKGQALVIVLLMMLFGSLIVAPVLAHMSSGIKVGQNVYEEKMHLLYAADSGVEDALWRMNNDQLNSDLFGADDPEYDPYAYYSASNPSYAWDYDLPKSLNDNGVGITFKNMWIPKDISIPSLEVGRSIIEEGKLIITGALSGVSETEYQIKIAFYWENEAERESLRVEKIGIWLPPGFNYNDDCNLSGACAPSLVQVGPYKSGEAVVWNFSSQPQLTAFPGSSDYPMVKTVTFQFLGPSGQKPGSAVSWIDTIGVGGIDYTWDADVEVYSITSIAGGENGIEVEAYAAKIEMRKLGSAVSGDYSAVGDTLLTHTGSNRYRNQLYMQSDAAATSGSGEGQIPTTATVEAAYLYWSGWIDFHYAYGSGHSWEWREIEELIYPEDPTQANLTTLVEEVAKVNRVSFGASTDMDEVTACKWQVAPIIDQPGSEVYGGTWFYACFYNATDKVRQLIEDEKVSPNGAGTYFVKHADSVVNEPRVGYDRYYFDLCDASGPTGDKTGYPLATPAHKLPYGERQYRTRYQAAYAGWSLVIIYSSPETKGHQLYLYDIATPGFTFVLGWHDNPDFDGDGEEGGMISGFIAPDEVIYEEYAARLTCFVGEGDEGGDYTGDQMIVNDDELSNTYSPEDDVWNGKSPGLSVPGIDIDTFTVAYPTIDAGATWAQVDLPTDSDGFMLVYIILSFRSKVASGGTLSYLVR